MSIALTLLPFNLWTASMLIGLVTEAVLLTSPQSWASLSKIACRPDSPHRKHLSAATDISPWESEEYGTTVEDLGTGCSDADTQGSCTRGASGCCAEVSCRELLGGLCLREPWRTKSGPAHKGKNLWAKRLRPKTVRGGPACISCSRVPPASWSLPLIPWFKKDWTPWLTTYHRAQRTRGKRPFVPSRSAHSTKTNI